MRAAFTVLLLWPLDERDKDFYDMYDDYGWDPKMDGVRQNTKIDTEYVAKKACRTWGISLSTSKRIILFQSLPLQIQLAQVPNRL